MLRIWKCDRNPNIFNTKERIDWKYKASLRLRQELDCSLVQPSDKRLINTKFHSSDLNLSSYQAEAYERFDSRSTSK